LQPAHNFALSTATSTCPAKSRSPTTCRGRKCQCQAHNHSNVPAATAVSRRVVPPQRPRHFAQPPDHEVIIRFTDLTGARVVAEIGEGRTDAPTPARSRHPMPSARQASAGLMVFLRLSCPHARVRFSDSGRGRVVPVGPPHP
jgi:hypothetical protein